MNNDDDLTALVALVIAGGACAPRRRLLEQHATPAAALRAGPSAWRAAGLAAPQVALLQSLLLQAACSPSAAPVHNLLQRSRDWLASPQHHLIGWHDADYPALLRQAPNPPLALFVAGDPTLLWRPSVAVVGSRGPSHGGCELARDFTRQLCAHDLVIVSGLAAGIDRAAHETALATGGHTVAVLGTGPDIAYPPEHTALMEQIAERGAVISEHPPGTGALREHFPSRNRILAGLSLGTLVIEAALRSGALITARLAAEAGRDVFAVPGSIRNPMARGCHRLIRDGASLVENAKEVVAALAPCAAALGDAVRDRLGAEVANDAPVSAALATVDSAPVNTAKQPPRPRDPAHHRLWCALGHDPTDMDQLVQRTGLTAAALSAMLLTMELQGWVVVHHGRYVRGSPYRQAAAISTKAPKGASRGT